MRIEFAHLQERSTTGQLVDFAVFHAKANSNTDSARDAWLAQLILAAQSIGRKVDAAALVYNEHRQIKTWGHPFVLDYLFKRGVPRPNYYVEIQ
ncbi:MAG TPA: hypothetical protein VE842_08065 [Pyrinomonadaceae bacterium]|nr:hypothetical protein [Pyrinomonadaceae bacterium]